MKQFTLLLLLFAAFSLTGQDNYRKNGAFYVNPDGAPSQAVTPQGFKWALVPDVQTWGFAALGGSGIQTASEAQPAGADWRAGFLMRAGNVAFSGSGGYSGYYANGIDNQYFTFEGTVGAFAMPQFAVTVGFSYYGDRNGTDGKFGLVLRPYLMPYARGRFSALTSLGFVLSSDTRTWQALGGIAYRL